MTDDWHGAPKAVCRGSWALGSQCGRCQRCLETAPAYIRQLKDEIVELKAKLAQPLMRITRDLCIDPKDVTETRLDRRHYANGPGPTFLIIEMKGGRSHRIEHTAGYLDGIDVYKIEKELTGGK